MKTYNLHYDHISKVALMRALNRERLVYEEAILNGAEENMKILHEQVIQIMRAVLYAKPIEKEEAEAPSQEVPELPN